MSSKHSKEITKALYKYCGARYALYVFFISFPIFHFIISLADSPCVYAVLRTCFASKYGFSSGDIVDTFFLNRHFLGRYYNNILGWMFYNLDFSAYIFIFLCIAALVYYITIKNVLYKPYKYINVVPHTPKMTMKFFFKTFSIAMIIVIMFFMVQFGVLFYECRIIITLLEFLESTGFFYYFYYGWFFFIAIWIQIMFFWIWILCYTGKTIVSRYADVTLK